MAQVTEAEQYQVFINHRGPDTKDKLASPIYNDLVGYGLEVFLDREELVKGGTALREIPNAIKSASVFIAIFSPTYAESHWCLDELHWMWCSPREEKVIYPVFCDVEPNDIRDFEKGCYAKDLDKYRQEGKKEVNEWMVALREVSKINGFLFKTDKSDYGKFQKDIVDIVIKHVKWNALEVASHPVGLDEAWKDLQDRNQKCGSKEVVVIAGVSGIGKSTLARHIFNDLSRPVIGQSEFSRACYLCNVRETVDLTLQRQLYCDLLGKDWNIRNTYEGKAMLQKSLKGLKFLIVFDDVDDGKKLKSVLDIDAVEPGSRIFITSLDKDLYNYYSNTFVYDVQLLEQNHARELFCYHAFRQVNPLEGYADLVDKFLEFCEGLPFLLEVLGQQFRGRPDRTYWEEHLASFFQSGVRLPGVDPVIEKLKCIYAPMINESNEQLKMFLDVAYFFVGEDQELAIRVLEGLDYAREAGRRLQSLRQNCLVNFKKDVESRDEIKNHGQDIAISEGKHLILPAVLPKHRSKIIMHNQVWILARDIVSNVAASQDFPRRLSCSSDIEKMLGSQSGSTTYIRGICIRKDRSPPQLPDYINIKGVRLLVVEHPIDSSWFRGSRISGNLVWLRWRNSPLTSLPSTILVRDLRVLELESSKDELEGFFDSIDVTPSELRELNIDLMGEGASSSTSSSAQPVHHSAKSFDGIISTTLHDVMPFFFRFLQSIGTLMKNFDKIVLKNVTVPQTLPIDYSELKNLRHLDLSGSTNLTTLPNSFSQLSQLQHLALRDCINLSIPTDILGEISTLEHIDLKGCARLVYLPQGISAQRRLRYLNLLQTSLLDLPFHLEPVDKLEQLRIGSATLTELPNSVAHFVNLKELILVKCVNLGHISTPIEQLKWLERLEIYGSKLPILPAGIAQLKHLRVLTIYSSPIEEFAFDNNVMYALTDFTLINTSVRDISFPVGACPRLEIVDLSYNRQLQQVEVFPSTVVKLNLEGCSSLVYLNLSELVHLKFLNINGCGRVETLDVENWRSLEEIMAKRCSRLRMREAAWNQLERLNFFSFSQGLIITASWQWRGKLNKRREYLMGFEKFMLNSFHDVTVLEVPATTTATSPLLLKNVHSHTAILMCFLTTDNGQSTEHNKFKVRFEACNGGARSKKFKTASGDGEGGVLLHMYMWTHNSKLFKDEDDIYSNVAIYKEGNFDVEGGERGWILTFVSQNRVLNVCNQIMEKWQIFADNQIMKWKEEEELEESWNQIFGKWKEEELGEASNQIFEKSMDKSMDMVHPCGCNEIMEEEVVSNDEEEE